MIFMNLWTKLLQTVHHLVAVKRVFKTPRYKDLLGTHRRDECLFLGLGSLMIEVVQRLSTICSCNLADPANVNERLITPKELSLGF